ncbi:hypothetical protein [Mucilaginibacter sp. SP1R1]|uniref:hypothetical protein n=1 Tax=Mucilaginibacter sp. SP1R1 TaxID=2723091 RepID=UPI003AFF6A14
MDLTLFSHVVKWSKLSVALLLCAGICACNNKPEHHDNDATENTLFKLLPSTQTHIDFSNILTEGLNTNVLMYEYFYNGGEWPLAM